MMSIFILLIQNSSLKMLLQNGAKRKPIFLEATLGGCPLKSRPQWNRGKNGGGGGGGGGDRWTYVRGHSFTNQWYIGTLSVTLASIGTKR